jgi:uncharacterized protein YeaC (DUF1315 family)
VEFNQLIQNVSPSLYKKLCESVETGKWLDGKPLTQQQYDSALQVIIAYQAKVSELDQHMNVGSDGQIIHKTKQELRQQFVGSSAEIVRFNSDEI